MNELLELLENKDDKVSYEAFKKISLISSESDEYYCYFEQFLAMIYSKNSFVRTRGFILCCNQVKWDKDNKLEAALPELLTLLNDPKPITVRQCLKALHEVLLYKPHLQPQIEPAVGKIDYTKYKDSMTPLIKKDVIELLGCN